MSVPENGLLLDGGAIAWSDGSGAATIGHAALPNQAGHKVKDRPYVTAMEVVPSELHPGADGIYGAGEQLVVAATFSEPVTLAPANAFVFLTLELGGVRRTANLAGADAATLHFAYTVQAHDLARDAVGVPAGALTLETGATLRGAGDKDAWPVHAAYALAAPPVDGRGAITVALASTPANGSDYLPGETIAVQATWDAPVTVSGTPAIGLEVGGVTQRAGYDEAASSAAGAPVFSYVVRAQDLDRDGVSVPAGELLLGDGAALDYRDGAGAANLRHAGLDTQAGHKVKDRPWVTGVTLAADADPGRDGIYTLGEKLRLAVTFSEAVTAAGAVHLTLTVGEQQRQAALVASGDALSTHRFAYEVQAGDRAPDGVAVAAGTLALGAGASLAGSGGVAAWPGHGAASFLELRVDAAGAVTVELASEPLNGSDYLPGEVIEVTATFRRPVTVSGTPAIGLEVGGRTHRIGYVAGPSSATELRFRYQVQADDVDRDGVSVPGDSLALDGGAAISYQDGTGLANLSHARVGLQAGQKVKDRPWVRAIEMESDPGADGLYTEGEEVAVEVLFSEGVSAGDATTKLELILELDGVTPTVLRPKRVEVTGTAAAFVFLYRVDQPSRDTDGVAVPENSLRLVEGTLHGTGDRAAYLAHGARPFPEHRVDGRGGVTVAIASAPGDDRDDYLPGDTIEVTATFARPVTGEHGERHAVDRAAGGRRGAPGGVQRRRAVAERAADGGDVRLPGDRGGRGHRRGERAGERPGAGRRRDRLRPPGRRRGGAPRARGPGAAERAQGQGPALDHRHRGRRRLGRGAGRHLRRRQRAAAGGDLQRAGERRRRGETSPWRWETRRGRRRWWRCRAAARRPRTRSPTWWRAPTSTRTGWRSRPGRWCWARRRR